MSVGNDFNVHVYDITSMEREMNFHFGYACLAACVAGTEALPLIFVGGADYPIKMFAGTRGFYGALEDEARRRGKAPPTHSYCLAKLEGHSGKIRALAASPDGQFVASGGEDCKIMLWSATVTGAEGMLDIDRDEARIPTKAPARVVSVHHGHITALAFSSEPGSSGVLLASGSNDHSLAVWKLSGGSLTQQAYSPKAHDAVVSAIAFGRGECKDIIFTGDWNGNVKVWKTTAGGFMGGDITQITSVNAADNRISSLCVSTTGQYLVATTANGASIVFNCAFNSGNVELRAASSYPSPSESTLCSAAIKNTFLTGSETGTLRLWPFPGANPALDYMFTDTVAKSKEIVNASPTPSFPSLTKN